MPGSGKSLGAVPAQESGIRQPPGHAPQARLLILRQRAYNAALLSAV